MNTNALTEASFLITIMHPSIYSGSLNPELLFLTYDTLNSFLKRRKNVARVSSAARHFYTFIFIDQGEGHCIVNGARYSVSPQNLIVIQPHANLLIDDVSMMEGRVLCFDEILFSRTTQLRRYLWRMLSESVKCPVISLSQPGIIYEYIKFQLDMFDKQFMLEENSVVKDQLLHNILSNIFILINVSLDETPVLTHFTIRKKRLLHFLELLEIHFVNEHNLHFYANKMNFSTQRLNVICNESLGINAKRLLQEKILREAKRLLLFETKTPVEVASLLGFKDEKDFKHFFDTQSNSSCEAFLWQHQLL